MVYNLVGPGCALRDSVQRESGSGESWYPCMQGEEVSCVLGTILNTFLKGMSFQMEQNAVDFVL